MRTMSKWFLLLSAAALLSTVARAEDNDHCQLTIGTGPSGLVYSSLYDDLRRICGAEVQLCELKTQGGLQNSQELANNKVELGFVQVDTLWDLRQSDERIAELRTVAAVSSNMLHILALRDGYIKRGPPRLFDILPGTETRIVVKRTSDLKGLPVVVVGSAQHLVPQIDKQFGLGLDVKVADSEEQALARVRSGDVAAMLVMSSWPSRLVESLPRESGMRLVNFDLPLRPPYRIVHKSYPKQGVFNVDLLAVKTLLVTRDFRPDGPYGTRVAALQRCLVDSLETLREGRFDSGWREVREVLESHGVPLFHGMPAKPERR